MTQIILLRHSRHSLSSKLRIGLLLHWQHIFFRELSSVVGDVGEVCSCVVGIAGRETGGGDMDDCHDATEVLTEMSPSPSSCRISAITGESLVGWISNWRCHLHFTGGAGGDRLIAVPAPSPAVSGASFLDAARVRRLAAAAFFLPIAFVVAAAAPVAAAAGAAVAARAATAA